MTAIAKRVKMKFFQVTTTPVQGADDTAVQQWMIDENITIIGWTTRYHVGPSIDAPSFVEGVADYLLALGIGAYPLESGILRQMQGRLRHWEEATGICEDKHQKDEYTTLMLPEGYGIDLEYRDVLYLHNFCRCSMLAGGLTITFTCEAIVFYVER